MGKRIRPVFTFEKGKSLCRSRGVEYREGRIAGEPAIIQRFSSERRSAWREFVLRSRVRHPLLLPAGPAGYLVGGDFACAFPLDFVPSRVTDLKSPWVFAAQWLSLAMALDHKGLDFRLQPRGLMEDRVTGRVVITGLDWLRERPSGESRQFGVRVLAGLRAALAQAGCRNAELEKILRNRHRRRENAISHCLRDLLESHPVSPEQLVSWFESSRTRERELVAGLFQLARQSRGRAVLFRSDPGEGKTSLLDQISRDLTSRDADVVRFSVPREQRPYSSVRRLFERFFEVTSAYNEIRDDLAIMRRIRVREDLLEFPEEALVAEFLRVVDRLRADTDQVFVFLVDDLDHIDPQSLAVITHLARNLYSAPVLFAATSTRKLSDLPESMVVLDLEPLPLSSFEEDCYVPWWKSDQRRAVLHRLYRRTSGNRLLFQETLLATLRRGGDGLRWTSDGWLLDSPRLHAIPDSAAVLYLRRMPEMSEQEERYLEAASVQGGVFDPQLIETDAGTGAEVLTSLSEKGVLQRSKGICKFRRPLVAEYIYQNTDPARRRVLHSKLADRLSRESAQDSEVARHFLKAGRIREALDHACRGARRIRFNTAQVILPILDELEQKMERLEPSERLRLLRQKAELLFRRGRYPSAVETLRRALIFASEVANSAVEEASVEVRFDLSVRLAESLFHNNEILAAQEVLRNAEKDLTAIGTPELMIRFYFCRGACAWHRGRKERDDFQKALDLAEDIQDFESLAGGYRQLAELALRGGVLTDARSLATRALKYAHRTGGESETGQAYRILGTIAWRRSLHRTAERILKRSMRHFRRAGALDGLARIWSLLGNVYVEEYRFLDAVAAFHKATAIFSQLDHPLEVSLAQFNLGLVYIEQGRIAEAEKIHQRCRAMDRKAGNKRYYAYDLRALAVTAVLRGAYRKAARLLRRTIEICREIHADGDVLQTEMILLMSELEQKNYRQAQPLVASLLENLESIQEPMAQAEARYLLGHYYGFINETDTALKHLNESLRLARRIRHFKLAGMCLMLRLVFRSSPPTKNDPDLTRAILCFRKSHNELRLCDYLLKLYQAYPVLLKDKEHSARLEKMERVYRKIRHRVRYRAVRELAAGRLAHRPAGEPMFDWWHSLLRTLSSGDSLESRCVSVLAQMSEELHAASAGLRYRDPSGGAMGFHHPAEASSDSASEFHEGLWKRILMKKEAAIVDVGDDPELSGCAWAQWHDARSVLIAPIVQEGQILGMWHFERWGSEPSFARKDLSKIAFFSMISSPWMESMLQAAWIKSAEADTSARLVTDLVGRSPAMLHLQRQIARLAPLDISVLILGESGTGKELIARELHRNSKRAAGPFCALNCSSIPETLVESELFGHARGAFTGAAGVRQGYIERAQGGTLFLDEIGDLSLAAQAKLLRVMQEKEIYRLGETTPRKVDVRFLFATHRDVKRMVRDGTYREDLYYRISSYTLHVPALRDRREDIPRLLTHFTEHYARAFARGRIQYSSSAVQALCDYGWPGNVREMENIVQSLLVNVDSGSRVDVRDLPPQITGGAAIRSRAGMTLEEARQEFEREFLRQALQKSSWNKSRTARELGITRQGLIQMLNRLGIDEKH